MAYSTSSLTPTSLSIATMSTATSLDIARTITLFVCLFIAIAWQLLILYCISIKKELQNLGHDPGPLCGWIWPFELVANVIVTHRRVKIVRRERRAADIELQQWQGVTADV